MANGKRRYTDDVPGDAEGRVRRICTGLPEVHEERAWVGTRWRVRRRTFAHVLGVADEASPPRVVLAFRSTGEELETLRHVGHPFFILGWGRDAVGMVLDDSTDWAEVRELVIESYCALAPKKLAALIDRPSTDG